MSKRKTNNKISFVLPGRGTKPVGGFKIIYTYANCLVERGHEVSLIHVSWLYKRNSMVQGLARFFYCLFFYQFYKKWFILDKRVKNRWILAPFSFLLPNSDIIVASSWETAEHVATLPSSKGKGFYLIQCDESEFTYVIKSNASEHVINSWKLPLEKIVICTWLEEKINNIGEPCFKVFNGLDFNDFFIHIPFTNRSITTIMMLHHNSQHKGSNDGFEALRRLKKKGFNLKVIVFGVPERPKNIEEWIYYYQKPTRSQLCSLYNEAAIFLSPSYSEGWGLPVSEAMQCGCATVTTNIGGFKDFVVENITSLCFNPGNIEAMLEKLVFLIENPLVAKNLAENGNKMIQQFTWEKSVDTFESILIKSKYL